jgi:small subunit ribosomal protein S9
MAEHKKTVKKTAPAKEKAAPKKKKAVKVEAPKAEAAVVAPAPRVEAQPIVKRVAKLRPVSRLPEGTRYYGTGRRKEATAKVWLAEGSGKMVFNGKSLNEYFCGRRLLEFIISRPFVATQTVGRYDIFAELLGGGVPSQADAVRMGIARALVVMNPAFKTILKKEGLMTRDPRMKERKKYGLKRARRAFQYTKR